MGQQLAGHRPIVPYRPRTLLALVALAWAVGCSPKSGAPGGAGAAESGAGGAGASDAGSEACAPPTSSGYGPCALENILIPKGGTYVGPYGCQTCSCAADGGVSCEDRPCGLCSDTVFQYDEDFLNVQSCKSDSDCTGRATLGLQCPCPVAVNSQSEHGQLIADMTAMQGPHEGGACPQPCSDFTCGACPAIVGARCKQGRCQTIFASDTDAGAADSGSDADSASDAAAHADAGL